MDHLIEHTVSYVKQTLENAETGHDWFHIERVWKTAKKINLEEQAAPIVVELAALLHDIADPKFHDGDETIGPKMAQEFLEQQQCPADIIEEVLHIIKYMSFKNSFETLPYRSKAMDVVQDADRLDAIGAIGIARAFTYGGYKNRVLYDPSIAPMSYDNKEAYKNSKSPTINHFYEKLFLLKDSMQTRTGKAMAEKRDRFMQQYLEQFYAEWEGQA